MDFATLTWLGLGFALGLVHAFDADHVMALSVFASRGRARAHGMNAGLRAGLRWSLGHGVVLVGAGCCLLFLGRALPAEFALAAERGVGGLMIALGVWTFSELIRYRGHLHFHEHGGYAPHAHWHSHEEDSSHLTKGLAHHHPDHHHEHTPLFVGGLHGLAGSAPILAVLPAATRSPLLGVLYLLLFALGVSLAMAAVSGALGHFAGRLQERHDKRGLAGLRVLSGTGSIALGVWMLVFV